MKVKTTVNSYGNYFYAFGMLTVLYLLEYFENEENYEECDKIVKAIREQEKRLDTSFYTKITKDCIIEVMDAYNRNGLNPNNAIEMAKFYKNEILETIL